MRAARRRWVWAVRVVAALAVGVVVQVGIAWWCVWEYQRQGLQGPLRRLAAGEDVGWLWKPRQDLEVTDVIERRAFGVRFEERYHLVEDTTPSVHLPPGAMSHRRTVQGQQLFRAGWPWRGLEWWDSYDGGPAERITALVDGGRVMLVSWSRGLLVFQGSRSAPRGTVWLPVVPSGLGFVGNTLVYACAAWGIGWLVGWCPGKLRARSRRRGGRCVGCGYQLAGMAVCSECGAEV